MPKAQINGIDLYYEIHGQGGISRSSTRSICDVAGSILAARRQLLDNENTIYRLEIPGVSACPRETLDNRTPCPSPSPKETEHDPFPSNASALQHRRNPGQFLSASLCSAPHLLLSCGQRSLQTLLLGSSSAP